MTGRAAAADARLEPGTRPHAESPCPASTSTASGSPPPTARAARSSTRPTRRVVTEVDVATDEQVQAAIAAARRAFDATDWPRHADRRTRRAARPGRRPASTATSRRWPGSRRSTPARRCARAAGTWPTSRASSATTPTSPTRTPAAWSTPSNPDALSRIVYEPVGVCGLIGPWNYPLLQLSWKIAPALAAGNTAVMKPAQLTPLTAIHLTRLLEEAGVPAGVVNLVLGPGERVGQALADSPDVDLDLADRRPRGRPGADARRGGQRQEGRARARRQEPEHRVRRRRLRDGRRQRADRGLHPLRPGLLGRLPGDRPGRRSTTGSSRRSAGAPTGSGSGAGSTTRPRPARSSRPRTGPRSRPTSPRAIAEGARLVAGGRRPDEPELQAGFFYRPTVFADVHAATCGSSARRSSGRS